MGGKYNIDEFYEDPVHLRFSQSNHHDAPNRSGIERTRLFSRRIMPMA
jgi:hypothetical protein